MPGSCFVQFTCLSPTAVMTTNLIIQCAAPLSSTHAQPLLELACGTRAVVIDAHALRIENANAARHVDIAAYCHAHALDYTFFDADQRLTDFGLLAIDMDSTLITIECIDELADFGGLKAEVAALTEASMRGDESIPFDVSLTQRTALLAGLDGSVLERVYAERLQLSPGAERLLAAVRVAGLKTLLISGGFTFFTDQLKARLNFDYAYANTLEIIDGKLTGKILGEIIDADVKVRKLRETCASLGMVPARAIALGDGANDLKMMAEAGLSVAFRAKPVVQRHASIAFNYVGLDGLLRLF